MATARLTNNFLAQAKRDNNRVTTWLGVSSVDGVTPINIVIDSVTGRVLMDAQTIGSHSAVTNRELASRDGNYVTTAMGVSENDDGTVVDIVADSPGILRVKGV